MQDHGNLMIHDACGEVQLNDSLWAKKTSKMSPLNECYILLERIFKAKETFTFIPYRAGEEKWGMAGGALQRGIQKSVEHLQWSFFSKIVPSQMFDCFLNTPLWALVGISFCIYNIFLWEFWFIVPDVHYIWLILPEFPHNAKLYNML